MPLPILGLAGIIGGLIDKIIPDKNGQKAAKAELAKLEQSGELQIILGQIGVNLEEAKSESLFVAGWRPFVGWICGFGLLYAAILYPTATFWVSLTDSTVQVPELNTGMLWPVLMGMLGLGGMRSYEKFTGSNKRR